MASSSTLLMFSINGNNCWILDAMVMLMVQAGENAEVESAKCVTAVAYTCFDMS